MELVLRDASIIVNGVDLSDHCSQVEVADVADEVDLTTYSPAAFRAYGQGFKDVTITATFFQDFAASLVHSTLSPIYSNDTPIQIAVKPTSAPISATNPSFQMIGLLLRYDGISGGVGDAATVDALFCNATSTGLAILDSDTDGGSFATPGGGSVDGGSFALVGGGSYDGGTL